MTPEQIQALLQQYTTDPEKLLYASSGILAFALFVLYILRARRRDGRRNAAKAAAAAPAPTPAKPAEAPKAEQPAPVAAAPKAPPAPQAEPEPAAAPAPAAAAPLTLTARDAVTSAPAPARPAAAAATGLEEIGLYTPHFDFADSDSFREAVREVRDEQAQIASGTGVTVALDGADAAPGPLARLAARAYIADCDVAISAVRWNTVDQMEQRLAKTEETVNAALAGEGLRLNPDFTALKLKELRLTHEQREKQKEERDLRAELARVKKEEMQLAKDALAAEKEEARIEALLTRAKQAAQKAGPDEAFEHEAKIGELTRQLEDAHRAAERAREMVNVPTAGFVYVVSNVGALGEGVVKIGMTRRPDPEEFIAELGQDAVPFPFDPHAVVYSEDAEALCKAIWAAFDGKRLNRAATAQNGFFEASLDEVAAEIARHAPDAAFSSTVEAQGYRQTLAERQHEPA